MVLLVKLRVVAFLIFCTLAQSAPTDVENAAIRLSKQRSDTAYRGIPTLRLFPNELVRHPNPDKLLLGMIATIAAEVFPEPEIYPIERLLSPLDTETMDRDQIRLNGAYCACVVEKVKCIFIGINRMYHAGYKELTYARTLAWNYLLILRKLGIPYVRCLGYHFTLPVLPDDMVPNLLVGSRAQELSHETALSRDEPSSEVVNEGIGKLTVLTKLLVTELRARKRKERTGCFKLDRLDMANWLLSQLEGRNAHGSDNSVLPMEFTNDVDISTPNPDNSMEFFDFFRNEIDHEGHHDQPTSEFIDFLERLKEDTLRIQEPSPLALSSSHWHHSESSSHNYDKGKRPMHDDGATDIYPTPRSKRFG
ncbi:hypothetical protein SeMB42_g02196 [Synchytrium endobioticum]|uniref:Uncharacterized protein n=1 Tax=Synchytrium endobioticum TaxID=286115 RepID=A0A507DIA2_9FUNG|nr:hypothetical protein SeMB42_g02196 [Synchytrium endobioticum]